MDDLTSLDRKEATKFAMQHFVITGDKAKNVTANLRTSLHLRVGVAAETLQEAIDAVNKQYPGCKIYSVVHQGPIEIVVKK